MSLWPRFVAEFGHLASQSIKIKHWLLWKVTLQSDLIIKAITKNWRLVWWDLLLRFLFAALLQTNKVVEKDPTKNWFKLPGKPVGKWEIAIPKADSMRLWLKSSCAKSSLVVAISTVPGTYLYPFYNHFQQQVTPSPAASLQLHCTPSGAPLGSEASVGAVQSPPRNRIATIKIELWLLWKLFITW